MIIITYTTFQFRKGKSEGCRLRLYVSEDNGKIFVLELGLSLASLCFGRQRQDLLTRIRVARVKDFT